MVESHFTLGVAGVLVIASGTFTAIMASAWMGIKSTPMVTQVVPFIAFGIGIDDMLVLAQAYVCILRGGVGVRVALGEVLAESGPSVSNRWTQPCDMTVGCDRAIHPLGGKSASPC